jgi:hypothetical protein
MNVGWWVLNGVPDQRPMRLGAILDTIPTDMAPYQTQLVRIYYKGRLSTDSLARLIGSAKQKWPRALILPGNEPDVPAEGYNGNPIDYANLICDAAKLSGTRVWYPGISPTNTREWLLPALGRAEIEGYSLHVYGLTVDEMLSQIPLDMLQGQRWGISETNFGYGRVADRNQWASVFREFLRIVEKLGCEYCAYFAREWPYPD